MKVITMLNEKGGVGKTTLAVTLACGLAAQGWKVLLVDSDPQGNAGLALGVAKSPGLYDLLVRDADWHACLKSISQGKWVSGDYAPRDPGRLAIVPSNIETRAIPLMLADEYKLKLRLEQIDGAFEIAIIDTSPTPSLMHAAIYAATDAILYPTQCEALALDGLMSSIARAERLDHIAILGIIPMMFRAQTLEHQDNLDAMREKFWGMIWEPIALRTVWAEACHGQVPVYEYAARSEAAAEAWNLVSKVKEFLHETA